MPFGLGKMERGSRRENMAMAVMKEGVSQGMASWMGVEEMGKLVVMEATVGGRARLAAVTTGVKSIMTIFAGRRTRRRKIAGLLVLRRRHPRERVDEVEMPEGWDLGVGNRPAVTTIGPRTTTNICVMLRGKGRGRGRGKRRLSSRMRRTEMQSCGYTSAKFYAR